MPSRKRRPCAGRLRLISPPPAPPPHPTKARWSAVVYLPPCEGSCRLLVMFAGAAGCVRLPARGLCAPGGRCAQRWRLPTLRNDSYEPGVELLVADALRREFLRRGAFQLTDDPAAADLVVSGSVLPIQTSSTQLLIGRARARVSGEPRRSSCTRSARTASRSRSTPARCARPSAISPARTWRPCAGTARRRCAGWPACSPCACTTRCSRWRRRDARGAAQVELAAGSLRPAYLIAGEEPLQRDEALAALREHVLAGAPVDFNLDRLEARVDLAGRADRRAAHACP